MESRRNDHEHIFPMSCKVQGSCCRFQERH
jgi:hypothetical protein